MQVLGCCFFSSYIFLGKIVRKQEFRNNPYTCLQATDSPAHIWPVVLVLLVFIPLKSGVSVVPYVVLNMNLLSIARYEYI